MSAIDLLSCLVSFLDVKNDHLEAIIKKAKKSEAHLDKRSTDENVGKIAKTTEDKVYENNERLLKIND